MHLERDFKWILGLIKTGIELEEAVKIILSHTNPLCETKSVDVKRICGRICAQDILSPLDLPPFNKSPLDGYAFRASDSIGASQKNPVTLKVIESIFAGEWTPKCILPGTAVRLMTGAPIPNKANCVIRQEEVQEEIEAQEEVYKKNGQVRIFRELSEYENFCHKGEDIAVGEVIVKTGECLNYIHAGILSGVGLNSIRVYRKPRVLLLETGDELIKTEFTRNKFNELNRNESDEFGGRGTEYRNSSLGKIYNINGALLSARLKELGVQVIHMGICEDSSKVIAKKISDESHKGDFMITTGGVSVGRKDLIPEVLKNFLEADVLFHGIKIKPGSPVMFSVYNNLPILSLSGNPLAAIITMELLMRPALAVLSHNKKLDICCTSGVLENNFPKYSPVRRFVYAIKKYDRVHITEASHSYGSLNNTKDCNCLVDIPAKSPPLQAGEKVRIVEVI